MAFNKFCAQISAKRVRSNQEASTVVRFCSILMIIHALVLKFGQAYEYPVECYQPYCNEFCKSEWTPDLGGTLETATGVCNQAEMRVVGVFQGWCECRAGDHVWLKSTRNRDNLMLTGCSLQTCTNWCQQQAYFIGPGLCQENMSTTHDCVCLRLGPPVVTLPPPLPLFPQSGLGPLLMVRMKARSKARRHLPQRRLFGSD